MLPSVPALSVLRRCCPLLAALLFVPAAALADWRHVEPPPVAAGPAVTSFVTGLDGSLWTFSATTVRRTGSDGVTSAIDRSDFADAYYHNNQRFAQTDGGMILVRHPSGSESDCALLRLDAALQPSPEIQLGTCSYSVNAAGAVWSVAGDRASQLNNDGSARVSVQRGAANQPERILQIKATADGGVLMLSRNGFLSWHLSRYDRDGGLRWSWSPPGPIHGFVETASGAIYTYADRVSVHRLDSEGRLQWQQTLDLQYNTLHSVRGAGESLYVINADKAFDLTVVRAVARFAADGSHWSRQVCPSLPQYNGWTTFAAAADGQSANICADKQIQRRDPLGNVVDEITLPQTATQMDYRADGSLLVLGRGNGAASNSSQLSQVDRSGAVHPGPPIDFDDNLTLRPLAQLSVEDGSTYLLTQAEGRQLQPPVLTRISAEGVSLWSRTLDAGAPQEARLSATATRICVSTRSGLQFSANCLDRESGAIQWSQPLSLETGSLQFIKALANGNTLLVQGSPTSAHKHEIVLRGADGSLLRRVTGDRFVRTAAFDENGNVAVYTDTGLVSYSSNGRQRFSLPGDDRQANGPALAFAADGNILLAERRGSEFLLRSLRPDGSQAWQTVLGSRYARIVLESRGDSLYVLESFSDTHQADDSRLSHLALADGVPRWRQALPLRAPARIALPQSGNAVLIAQNTGNRLYLQRWSGADGQLAEQRIHACGNSCSPIDSFGMDTAGTARMSFAVNEPGHGNTVVVQAIAHATAALPRTRADQPGIGGAWWSPYANGEGIALDWFPQQRTLFGAWFTYTSAGGNDPAQLRWYTIQAGDIAANATSVQLPILETSGGNFDAGPPVSPIAVGTATLSFSDCDNGTLTYAFDAGHNDGANGMITLSRLTPASGTCILADGTTRPGTGARPPQGGFDARMSGTWFEQAASGQGLQFTVQPGGTFFAPWFTYDPQDQGNDPNREHWFTLQGNLAGAVNGKAEVLIAQSLGGAFDRVPTYNGFAVGKASIRMTACDKASVDYRFDDNPIAGNFRNRSGTLELSKIGGCAP